MEPRRGKGFVSRPDTCFASLCIPTVALSDTRSVNNDIGRTPVSKKNDDDEGKHSGAPHSYKKVKPSEDDITTDGLAKGGGKRESGEGDEQK
jgi:hypothetical protein